MNTRSPADPKSPHATGDTYSATKPRRQRRPLGARTANKRSASGNDQKSVDALALTAIAKFDGMSKRTASVTEGIEYKGHTFKIEPHRNGWKAAIFPNGSPFALHRIAYSTEVSGRDAVIEQAKAIVDEATADRTLPKVAIEPAESPKDRSVTRVAFFLRIRGSLSQGWATLKRAYFSVDQPR